MKKLSVIFSIYAFLARYRRISIGIGWLRDYTGRLKVFIGCCRRIIGGFERFLIGGGAIR